MPRCMDVNGTNPVGSGGRFFDGGRCFSTRSVLVVLSHGELDIFESNAAKLSSSVGMGKVDLELVVGSRLSRWCCGNGFFQLVG